MEYFLTEEQKMIKQLAARIADERIKPVAAELDEKEEFPWELMKVLAEADLCGVYIPEEYGGLGGGVFEQVLVVEELSRACSGVAVSYAATGLGAFPILMFGTEEQKRRYLPEIAAGRKLAAFGLTEANAGSDAGAIETTAVRDGDHYVLNGTKQWITNGGEAEIYTIIAMTDRSKGPRGATAFIVEKGTPGFEIGKREDTMGIRCVPVHELHFKNCRVPAENLLGGKEGTGFANAMMTLDRARPGVAAQAVGLAQGALEWAIRYTSERQQFGQSVMSFQAIQFMLADMAIQIEAARQLVYTAARAIDAGLPNVSKLAAMAKVMATDTAMRVTTDAVQLFGGYGYCRDYPIEKYMRDAKITQIYEGTNQIQRVVIARALTREADQLAGHLQVKVEHFPKE
uniref:Cyclohex-1-ene-1-carbonyl-CoA dehydrogenase n=1 Tax=Thermoanaerobaculum aquaticum TaxID=1312852 RepID=A0A7C2SLQ0_9BACT